MLDFKKAIENDLNRAKTCEVTEADILIGDKLHSTDMMQCLAGGHGFKHVLKMIKHRRALEKFGHPVLR